MGATLRNSGLAHKMLQAGRKEEKQQGTVLEIRASQAEAAAVPPPGGDSSSKKSVTTETAEDMSTLSLDDLQRMLQKYQAALQQVQAEMARRMN